MNVKLINFTPNALDLLLGTKTTRLRGKRPDEMTKAEKYEHFQYMLDTIRSPFDFVDYIFDITEVSKNFTHQLVRTRTGAYQQESSRAVEVTGVVTPDAFEFRDDFMVTPDREEDDPAIIWSDAVADAQAYYQQLIAAGAELQDARAILPSNMETAIKAKFNLRTLSDMAKVRLCTRTQGEYQQVFRRMREEVLAVHPWAEPLLQVSCVATGQCAFPRWGSKAVEYTPEGLEPMTLYRYQCQHYRPWMDLSEQKETLRAEFWAADITQSNPVAKDGKTS
jgi:flavin-dependent thymidylate synthase